ncbi:hypothetical protein RND81_10G016800 [Saponaria officinalis]|uniref:Uncharacterized protein n=1 Tax=Saponaria officinalis TaxID=3572 RepID=A0AAW1HY37_SAPOF
MPTINGRVTKATFAYLEEKFNKRLAGWQTKHLSLAGRSTLVQSMLSTLANYSIQTAKLPRAICDSLDRKVLRAKYCNGRCAVAMFQPKPNMSNVWSAITSQAIIITRGATVAVGNGKTTLFWDHSWIEEGCLSNKALMNIPDSLLGATVSDMWDESSGWK